MHRTARDELCDRKRVRSVASRLGIDLEPGATRQAPTIEDITAEAVRILIAIEWLEVLNGDSESIRNLLRVLQHVETTAAGKFNDYAEKIEQKNMISSGTEPTA